MGWAVELLGCDCCGVGLLVGPSTLRVASWIAGSGALVVAVVAVPELVEGVETPLGIGFVFCADLFCGICTGCTCAVGIFKAWLHKAHIFNKAISRCKRLLLAAR